jgi:protein gp37
MATSSIEWTELTWNPTTGCDKVSAGCKFEMHDVAFFFKQWGGRNKKAAGRELEGMLHDTFPKAKKRRPVKLLAK